MPKAKARKRFVLPVLIALGSHAAADATHRDLPSEPCPALAAAPLVYALVLNPLGSKTWAERQLEEIRTGAHIGVREDLGPQASFILLALHERSEQAYALEMAEAPREPEAHAAADPGTSVETFAEPRMQSAFEAMGLTPEDLVRTPEVPSAALTLAGAILGLLDWGFDREAEFRERARGSQVLRIDPREREARPRHVRHQKPLPQEETPPLIFTKKVARSVYKILLGVAIGILIWGFVRNTT